MSRAKTIAVVLAIAALSGGATACGSNEDDDVASGAAPAAETASTAGDGARSAAVAKASRPLETWPGPAKGVEGDIERGKDIVVVTCSSQAFGCKNAADGVEEAGRELGWNVRIVDGKGSPQSWNSGVQNAVAQKVDGIVLDAVPPALVGDAVERARAAGIPIVSIFNPEASSAEGVFAYVRPDHTAQGRLMADWVASDSAGRAKVVLVEDRQFPELVQRVTGFQEQLAACSGCEVVATVQSQISTIAEKLPGLIVSTLQSHPDADYVVSPFDSNAIFASQGVRQAGRAEAVKVAGYEGDPGAVDAIRSEDIIAATIADPTRWMGWQAIDEFTRAFAGEKPSNVPVQWRLLTADNVPDSGTWTGDVDFKAEFRQLWGRG